MCDKTREEAYAERERDRTSDGNAVAYYIKNYCVEIMPFFVVVVVMSCALARFAIETSALEHVAPASANTQPRHKAQGSEEVGTERVL